MKFITRTYIISFLLVLSLMWLAQGCSGSGRERGRLEETDRMSESDPDLALRMLDSIPADRLSEADRNYYDLLTIKTRDKKYINHTSDSLILKVIDYYSRHSDHKLYPEALYYGGRVYADMGDLPTAIQYFHSALDLLPPETDNRRLRGKALSQTADMLISLRLYEKAISYIRESIKIDSLAKDSINLLYDTHTLGTIFLNMKNYDLAETTLNAGKDIASHIAPSEIATFDMKLAVVKNNKGDSDSALSLIRTVLNNINPYCRHTAIASAAKIYYKAHIPDTAIMLARKLIKDVGFPNRRIGYRILLSPDMREFLSPDSVICHAYESHKEMEYHLNKNGNTEAMIQESSYNYRTHLCEREKAEARSELLYEWIIVILVVMFGLAFYVFWLKYKSKSYLLKLHEAKNNLIVLRQELEKSRKDADKGEQPAVADDSADSTERYVREENMGSSRHLSEAKRLQSELREELLSILRENPRSNSVAAEILESDAYRRMCRYVTERKIISDTDSIWKDLERAVEKSSPDFRHRLNLLTGSTYKQQEINIILLVKCGFSPTHISGIVGRTKGAISQRRKKLGEKILGESADFDTIDSIIRLL